MRIACVDSVNSPLHHPALFSPVRLPLKANMDVTWAQFVKMNRIGLKYSGPKERNTMWLPARVKPFNQCAFRPWDNMPSRKRENIAGMSALVFDIDNKSCVVTPDQFLDWWPCKVMLGSTASSTHQTPKFRGVAPLSREVTPDEYRTIVHVLAGRAKVAGIVLDESSRDPERPYFWCQTSVTGHAFVEDRDAELFDPDEFMKTVQPHERPAERKAFDPSKLPPVDTSDACLERVKFALSQITPKDNTLDRNDVWMVGSALKAFGDRGFPIFKRWFEQVPHANSTAEKEWARNQPAVSLGMIFNRATAAYFASQPPLQFER